MALLLEYMPLKGDESEALVVRSSLIRLVAASDPRILGSDGKNLPRILYVILSVIGTKWVDESSTRKAVKMLKDMNERLPNELLASASRDLPEEQKGKLQAALNL